VRNSDSKSILRSYSRAAGRSEAVDSGWRIFLWWGPLFYAAEKPEKSASGLEIGRDVERDRSETKSPDDGCACFGAIS
jgi:hypothetical protein